jgi:hypothetical protein
VSACGLQLRRSHDWSQACLQQQQQQLAACANLVSTSHISCNGKYRSFDSSAQQQR